MVPQWSRKQKTRRVAGKDWLKNPGVTDGRYGDRTCDNLLVREVLYR